MVGIDNIPAGLLIMKWIRMIIKLLDDITWDNMEDTEKFYIW